MMKFIIELVVVFLFGLLGVYAGNLPTDWWTDYVAIMAILAASFIFANAVVNKIHP